MSKYVISFEDNPWYQDECVGYYKCGEIPWWSAKKTDIKKLIPLDKELDEAYQKGVHDGSLDVKQRVDGAYQKGYEAGQHEATTLEYQQGLDDAWGFASHLAYVSDSVTNSIYISANGGKGLLVAFGMTYEEAKKQYDEYFDKKQKADAEIKVGDEVCFVFAGGETIEPFIVFSIKDDNGKKYYEGIQTSDGRWVSGGLKYYKTGRYFPQIAELLKAMKGDAE